MPDPDLPIGTGWHLLSKLTAGDPASECGMTPFLNYITFISPISTILSRTHINLWPTDDE